MVELGISLGWSAREPVDRLVALAQRAERSGVAACWIIDSQLAMKDPYLALAVFARETERIALGPGVTNLVTRHETVVANTLATLATMAPGRVLAGVGAGDSAVFPLGRRPSSVTQLEDGVRRLRRLLAGEPLEGVQLNVRCAPAPPVWVSASQPRMLRLAGRVGDGVILMGPADPDTVAMQLGHVAEGAREAGRDPSEIRRDLWVTMAVGNGDGAAHSVKSWASAQARWLAGWKSMPPSLERYRAEMKTAADDYDFADHLSLSAGHAGRISDEFAGVLAVVGTTGECRDRLTALAALEIDRMTVSLLSGGREQRLDDLLSVWEGVSP